VAENGGKKKGVCVEFGAKALLAVLRRSFPTKSSKALDFQEIHRKKVLCTLVRLHVLSSFGKSLENYQKVRAIMAMLQLLHKPLPGRFLAP